MLQYLLYLFIACFIGIVGLCTYLLYVPFYFPKPTGNYAVGMQQYHWIDTTRQETRAHDPAHPYRELMVNVWYPAQVGNQVASYAPALLDFTRKKSKTITEKINSLLKGEYRPTYAYYSLAAPVAQSEKPFPVIILSPGFSAPAEYYTAYCTELASHGYVVCSINHTYDTQFVDFPDGRRVLMSSFLETMSVADRLVFLNNNIEIWIADTQFVLEQIKNKLQTKSDQFYGKLDIAHVGIFGHSFGGSTATQCCRQDVRFLAGCNIDGPLLGLEFSKPFGKPFMFLQTIENTYKEMCSFFDTPGKPEDLEKGKKWLEERWCLPRINELALKIGHDAYIINFENAWHETFCDSAILKHRSLYPRMHNYYGAGPADGFEITRTINKYLVAFLISTSKVSKQTY